MINRGKHLIYLLSKDSEWNGGAEQHHSCKYRDSTMAFYFYLETQTKFGQTPYFGQTPLANLVICIFGNSVKCIWSSNPASLQELNEIAEKQNLMNIIKIISKPLQKRKKRGSE